MTENKLIETKPKALNTFSNKENFEAAQRIAIALSKSNIIPSNYQNNVPNTLVALEMAGRIGISPLMVMQNLDIIKGKPSWRSSFIIAALNSCGRFKPLRFEFVGQKDTDNYGCRAYTFSTEDNERIESPVITWSMVKAEGWLNKMGSKWKTMPELMFQYRAASFFGRLYAPDILTGMYSVEETIDIKSETFREEILEDKHKELKEFFNSNEFDLSVEESMNIDRIIEEKEALSYDKAMSILTQKIKQ